MDNSTKHQVYFFAGLILGAALAMGIFLVFMFSTKGQKAQISTLASRIFEKEDKDSLTISDGEKYEIVLTRRELEQPQLSITDVELIDRSGSKKHVFHSNDKGIIVCTIENTGGIAKNVKAVWKKREFPEGLTIDPPKKPLSELRKNSHKTYKISVATKDIEEVRKGIKFHLYPTCDGWTVSELNSIEYAIDVFPKLGPEKINGLLDSQFPLIKDYFSFGQSLIKQAIEEKDKENFSKAEECLNNAIEYLEKVIENSPSADAYYYIARAYYEKKNDDKARSAAENAVQLANGNHPRAQKILDRIPKLKRE